MIKIESFFGGVIFVGVFLCTFFLARFFFGAGWEFVKGAMHLGETEEEAILREINEETHVKIKILGKIPKIYWGKKPYGKGFLKIKATAYACKYLSGEVKSDEPEHISHKWMDYEEAKSKIWLEQGDDVIEEAIKIYGDSK